LVPSLTHTCRSLKHYFCCRHIFALRAVLRTTIATPLLPALMLLQYSCSFNRILRCSSRT
jgi:hypothetical protein